MMKENPKACYMYNTTENPAPQSVEPDYFFLLFNLQLRIISGEAGVTEASTRRRILAANRLMKSFKGNESEGISFQEYLHLFHAHMRSEKFFF